ncbi:hypothetical protein [Streptomyces sp. NBC_00343]
MRTRLPRIAERTGSPLTDPRGITELALRAVRQTPRPPTPESTDDMRKS